MAVSEDKEALRQQIEEHKREVRLAVEELTTAAAAWPDPREHIRTRPFAWLLGGFLIGLWLGRPNGNPVPTFEPGGALWPR